MGYPDYCAICSESYDNDNLIPCSACGREVCYRCIGGGRLCLRCKPAASPSGAAATSATAARDGRRWLPPLASDSPGNA